MSKNHFTEALRPGNALGSFAQTNFWAYFGDTNSSRSPAAPFQTRRIKRFAAGLPRTTGTAQFTAQPGSINFRSTSTLDLALFDHRFDFSRSFIVPRSSRQGLLCLLKLPFLLSGATYHAILPVLFSSSTRRTDSLTRRFDSFRSNPHVILGPNIAGTFSTPPESITTASDVLMPLSHAFPVNTP
ncbi:hypothetical protein C8R43DRAFT_951778 [Mycena crocata]|nr:hypothetical protein C8R43DRAFT_951778 [Mycena crocata]